MVAYLKLSMPFQSTRPRGARLTNTSGNGIVDVVSIHAPARGATVAAFGQAKSTQGFNPRARAGRDYRGIVRQPFIFTFQSTRPRGARLSFINDSFLITIVSIHAPARGATGASITAIPGNLLFQSTRPRGARHDAISYPHRLNGFQSTRPRGARLPHLPALGFIMGFQSTRPRGARPY